MCDNPLLLHVELRHNAICGSSPIGTATYIIMPPNTCEELVTIKNHLIKNYFKGGSIQNKNLFKNKFGRTFPFPRMMRGLKSSVGSAPYSTSAQLKRKPFCRADMVEC